MIEDTLAVLIWITSLNVRLISPLFASKVKFSSVTGDVSRWTASAIILSDSLIKLNDASDVALADIIKYVLLESCPIEEFNFSNLMSDCSKEMVMMLDPIKPSSTSMSPPIRSYTNDPLASGYKVNSVKLTESYSTGSEKVT